MCSLQEVPVDPFGQNINKDHVTSHTPRSGDARHLTLSVVRVPLIFIHTFTLFLIIISALVALLAI